MAPLLGFLFFFPLLLYLGFWQLDRAEQKRTLHAAYTRQQRLPTMDFNNAGIDRHTVPKLLWRRINVSGILDGQAVILLDNRTLNGRAGYYVFSLLRLADAEEHLVINQGWLPVGADRTRAPELAASDAGVSVTGKIKDFPKGGILLSETVPERIAANVYRVQDINHEIAQELFAVPLLPYIVRLEPGSPHGYMRRWSEPGSGEEVNLGYAFQWFALATTLLVIFTALIVRKARAVRNDG